MASLPEPITRLAAALGRLPGVGPRSAERIALHLVQHEPAVSKDLAEAIVIARDRIRFCEICGGLTEACPCPLCSDPERDDSVICLVERPVDILSIEKSGNFQGRYHALGGKLSPLDGIGPDDLRISELENRLATKAVREVILALGTDVEGDATSHYLARRLSRPGLRITRIAHGLPAGSGIDYADELTLSRALAGRREVE